MTEADLTALAFALFDAENTSRPADHPEEMPAYRARAKALATWIEFHGYELRRIVK